MNWRQRLETFEVQHATPPPLTELTEVSSVSSVSVTNDEGKKEPRNNQCNRRRVEIASDLYRQIDWRRRYARQFASRQSCFGYSDDLAQCVAYGEAIETWCERHPLTHQPGICAGCSKLLEFEVLDLPDGARVHWEPEREFTCLVAYGTSRIGRAVSALTTSGLPPPPSWRP